MVTTNLIIRESTQETLADVEAVERAAFGGEEEAKLALDLIGDPTARPVISLLAYRGEEPVGHILFTRAVLEGSPRGVSCSILAPLAVAPADQRMGVGGELTREGLRRLAEIDVDLVFVLGHPSYYPRHGFTPAGRQGLVAPYPIPEKDAEAWMVQELVPGILGTVSGTVRCAETMDRPEYWRE